MTPDTVWRLLAPAYGITESGRLCPKPPKFSGFPYLGQGSGGDHQLSDTGVCLRPKVSSLGLRVSIGGEDIPDCRADTGADVSIIMILTSAPVSIRHDARASGRSPRSSRGAIEIRGVGDSDFPSGNLAGYTRLKLLGRLQLLEIYRHYY